MLKILFKFYVAVTGLHLSTSFLKHHLKFQQNLCSTVKLKESRQMMSSLLPARIQSGLFTVHVMRLLIQQRPGRSKVVAVLVWTLLVCRDWNHRACQLPSTYYIFFFRFMSSLKFDASCAIDLKLFATPVLPFDTWNRMLSYDGVANSHFLIVLLLNETCQA